MLLQELSSIGLKLKRKEHKDDCDTYELTHRNKVLSFDLEGSENSIECISNVVFDGKPIRMAYVKRDDCVDAYIKFLSRLNEVLMDSDLCT